MEDLTGRRPARELSDDQGSAPGWTGTGASRDDMALTLIADELAKSIRRADEGQWHARYLETVISTRSETVTDTGALAAANAELRTELMRLRMEHGELVRSTAWRIGRRVRLVGGRYPRTSSLVRQSLKLVYWTMTLRLASRLRQRRGAMHAMTLLAQSPLFDQAWYLRRYAGLLPPNTDPVAHYYWTGARQGLDPHPLFSSSWYLSKLSEASGVNPLSHYIAHRGRGTPDPHPLFDTAFFLDRHGAAARADLTPLEDFLTVTPDNTAWPNPVFNPALYVEEHLGGRADAPNALVHYVEGGEAAGLWPHPFFDPSWYGRAHPESRLLGPLGHYLRSGARADRLTCSEPMARVGRPVALPLELAFTEHDAPRISIVVPIYGHAYETWRCLATILLMTDRVSYQVIVADDRPGRPVARMLGATGITIVVNTENKGFLANCNGAVRWARGRDLVFLNNDTTMAADWLAPMVAVMDSDARVGVVGCKLLNPDGSVQEAGGIIYSTGWGDPFGAGEVATRGCYNYRRDVDVVTGACFLVRGTLFDRLGGFDNRYAPAFYEEFDLATSIRDAGYRIVYQPASEVWHHGSASYGIEMRNRQTRKNHAIFCKKWATLLARQPGPDGPSFLSRERPSPRGTILVVDDKVPEYDRHAGAVTLLQYLGLFRELGLRVVYAPHDGDPIEPYTQTLQQRGIEVLHRPDTLHGWLRKNGRFVDYVWTARPDVTTPILDWLKRYTGAKILYYTHDLHYLRERRRYELEGSVWALQESERLKPIELAIFRQVDCVMTPSADEASVIMREVPEANVTVIPPYLYGETSVEGAAAGFADRQDILFIGGFDHTPNVDAALWLVRDIMPLVWQERPDTVLWIVGNAPPEAVLALEGARVRVTGFVPDLEPYFDRARVSLSPLRYGAGVKGKIVTSLQAGIPVITTPCGNEGIRLRDGEDALIGESAQELASAALRLLGDAVLCDRLIRSGAAVVRTRFSKDLARRRLEALLGSTLCVVCGARPRQTRRCDARDWREKTHCLACGALNRDAGVVRAILVPWSRHGVTVLAEAQAYLADQRIHQFGHAGPIGSTLAGMSHLSRSVGVDGPEDAVPLEGTAREDVQNLSFGDESIDLFLSQDMMEHVADPWRGFAEIFRCLKPGGRHVFTIAPDIDPTAALANDGMRRASTLADPGPDTDAAVASAAGLTGRLSDIGFRVRVHEIDMPEGAGRALQVFETTRPAVPGQ